MKKKMYEKKKLIKYYFFYAVFLMGDINTQKIRILLFFS